MEIAPFYVGQEVVANRNHSQGVFKKGDEFKVQAIHRGCCGWNVAVGIKSDVRGSQPGLMKCDLCGRKYEVGEQAEFLHVMFSPKIEISSFISMESVANVEAFSQN